MNRIPLTFFKIAGSLILTVLAMPLLMAQKPEVRALDKTTGSTAEVVTIKGSSFGTNAAQLAITFGAVRGSILSVSDQLIEAQVPAGATFDNLAVTNLTSGLTGYSSDQFLLSFSGQHPFAITNLSTQLNFDSEKGLVDVHLGDLNNDGKVDAVTANEGSNIISIFRNTSSVGTVSFTKIPFALASTTLSVNGEDLNGDGLQDIVLVDKVTLDRIFILKNNGGFSFTAQEIKLTPRKNQMAEIADLDQDGKPEIIVTDNTVGLKTIAVLRNTSSLAAISFDPAVVFATIPGSTSDDVVAKDLNNDGLPEILSSQYATSTTNGIYIIPNLSSPGSLSFGTTINLPTGNRSIKQIKVGDLDGDGKSDIVGTNLFEAAPGVSVFRNTGSGNTISFSAVQVVTTDPAPHSFDLGDIDGDGKVDIIMSHGNTPRLTILNNQSTSGTISFIRSTVTTTYTNRQVKIGDVDGDGKPDVVFASIDPNASTLVSKVSVFRNRTCVIPKLSPANTPVSICSNFLPYRLQATVSPGSNYEWLKDGVLLPAANNGIDKNALLVTAALGSGEYTVRIIAEGGSCNEQSEPIQITIGTAGSPIDPGPVPNASPLCAGSPLSLTVTTTITGALYKWTGPNGFAPAASTNPLVTVTSDFRIQHAGIYYLEVIDGTGNCVTSKTSTEVRIVDIPTFSIAGPETVVLCQGSPTNLILSINPDPDGFTYQWYKDGAPFGSSGTTPQSPPITAAAASTGNYSVRASNAGCSLNIEPNPVNVKVVTPPTAAFTVNPTPACAGQKVKFTNTSTKDNTTTAFYHWYFGDTQTSTEESPEHIYTADNTYSVILEVTYANGTCLDDATTSITVTAATVPQIINPETAGKFDFCDGQSIPLGVTGSNITSYTWSTGATTPTITVSEGATYSVDIQSNGCTLTAFREITEKDAPIIIVTASPDQINEGETSQLSASGVNNFNWTPVESIESDPTIANPIARPLNTTTYTVTGSDGDCEGSATIQVRVIGEAIVSKLIPSNFFSPNESPPNDTWVVDQILDYPQCSITIYDDKGVKVFDAKPYNNDWDGTFNGKKLPDGVYFYIIRCEGEENKPRTGSITLLR